MKLIIGIGNPGKDYENTRHNTGFIMADELLNNEKTKKIKNLKILKSQNYMNESGEFVKDLVDRYSLPLNNLFVIHDDLDIALGEYKIQFARGPKDHNGLKSIDNELGTSAYWHVRIGIDNRPLDSRPMGEEFVLQAFTDDERRLLGSAIQNAAKEVIKIISQ